MLSIKNEEYLMQKHYDYIIAGAGLAGLSLAFKIKSSPQLMGKTILLVDRDSKQNNDRTWCFWSKEKEVFEYVVFKKWSHITYASQSLVKDFEISPYAYKMIRGIDFYNYTISFLKEQKGVDFLFENIESLASTIKGVTLKTKNHTISGSHAFKSYYEKNIDFSQDIFVWQHFKGIIIKTPEDSFDEDNAHFMDFRVAQEDETRFFYVLPLNKREALVEIAIFSSSIPEPNFYDPLIKSYITNTLGIESYEIQEEELGAIPMTTYNFQKDNTANITRIGTNGGSVKASSGYAFKRIQEDTDVLVNLIIQNKVDDYNPRNNRFLFYDKIMLHAVLSGSTSGETVFTKLFKHLKPQTIFKFLDEKGSFFNDLKVFTAPPTWPFLKSFFKVILKRM